MPHIRVLVPVTASGPRSADDLSGLAAPGVTLSCAFIPEGPPSIESRFDEAFSVPWLIALALEAEREGVDGLVIDCMGDPGLGALREAVDIPVVGVAQASMSIAAMLAQRFGVVTVSDRTTTMVNELVDLYGHVRHYVGCAPIDVPVLKIHDDPDKVRADLSEAALRLVEDNGAAAIILGCTGFLGCAEAIRARLLAAGHVLPVIDPVPTAVAMAATLVQLGLLHSRISYPAFERDKQFTGFAATLGKKR